MQDFFRQMLDEVGAFVYATDRQGRYIYANQLVLDLLSVPQLPDLLGKRFDELVPLDAASLQAMHDTDRLVIEQGQTLAREETHPERSTGALHTYWSIKKPLRGAAGQIIGLIGISHDITEKKRLEDQIRQQNILLDAVLNNVDSLVYMKSSDRRFLYANQHMARAMGQPIERIVGQRDTDLLPRQQADDFWRIDQQILASGQRQTQEVALPDAGGQMRHYWSVIEPCPAPDGSPALVGVSTDITELHQLKETLRRQAEHDSLTGLINRRRFWAQAERELALSQRHGLPLALLTLDIDHFKLINDTHGHMVGDQVLRAVAAACRQALRGTDLCARIGGEEFSILLPATALDGARTMAERIRQELTALQLDEHAPGLRASASLGLACAGEHTPLFDMLFSRADQALYAAKRAGRNRVMAWDDLENSGP